MPSCSCLLHCVRTLRNPGETGSRWIPTRSLSIPRCILIACSCSRRGFSVVVFALCSSCRESLHCSSAECLCCCLCKLTFEHKFLQHFLQNWITSQEQIDWMTTSLNSKGLFSRKRTNFAQLFCSNFQCFSQVCSLLQQTVSAFTGYVLTDLKLKWLWAWAVVICANELLHTLTRWTTLPLSVHVLFLLDPATLGRFFTNSCYSQNIFSGPVDSHIFVRGTVESRSNKEEDLNSSVSKVKRSLVLDLCFGAGGWIFPQEGAICLQARLVNLLLRFEWQLPEFSLTLCRGAEHGSPIFGVCSGWGGTCPRSSASRQRGDGGAE